MWEARGMETDADKLQLAQPRSESCIREVQTEVVCTGSRTWKMKRKKTLLKSRKKMQKNRKQKIPKEAAN